MLYSVRIYSPTANTLWTCHWNMMLVSMTFISCNFPAETMWNWSAQTDNDLCSTKENVWNSRASAGVTAFQFFKIERDYGFLLMFGSHEKCMRLAGHFLLCLVWRVPMNTVDVFVYQNRVPEACRLGYGRQRTLKSHRAAALVLQTVLCVNSIASACSRVMKNCRQKCCRKGGRMMQNWSRTELRK